jgi:hypothetical protein
MHFQSLNSLLVAVPALLVLVAAVMRVDGHLFSSEESRKAPDRRPRFAVTEEDGKVMFTDPDGRPFAAKGH